MLYVFTSCALNFVPCAKLLAASVKDQMPDARFVLVLTDEKPDNLRLEDEGFDEVLYLDDFSDQIENPRGWAFGHTIMELATAIKPFTACKLMERDDCDAVMFFDPDCVLFGPMKEMRAALERHSVVLTPHASLMHENDDWIFFEKNPLKVGGFNLGFFGLRNSETGRAVASWWRHRLKDYCLIDPDQGLFTDQKWMDLLPNYTDDYAVMREPVYNIARWNTFQRTLSREGDSYLADGQPVEFIHFSGFYKIGPYVRGLYDRSSEPLVDNIEVLQELSLWYSGKLDEARSHEAYDGPWPLGRYGNGQDIHDADRRRYKASAVLQERFPDPFKANRLDSYWLYCRKQERVASEVSLRDQEPNFNLVTRGVQAHNTLLRKLNTAQSTQLENTTRELVETRTELEQMTRTADALRGELQQRLRSAGEDQIRRIFEPLVASGAINIEAYLEANPDVAQSKIDPLVHFIRYGLAENRSLGTTDATQLFLAHCERFLEVARASEDDRGFRRPLQSLIRGRNPSTRRA